jgi:phenylpropionate dioxygenase-like ring-hydroxylating dioxygenase large terminal subunit
MAHASLQPQMTDPITMQESLKGSDLGVSTRTDAAESVQGGRDPEALLGFWYPALRAREAARGRMTTATLMEIPLVMGRDRNFKPFAMRDSCPHRGMPLSFGRIEGQNVECSYHGWQFNTHSGQCTEIPSLTPDSTLKCERIFAEAFPCQERDGYLWVFVPEPQIGGAAKQQPPQAPELPKFGEKFRMAYFSAEMPVSVDQGIIGLMDPAHGPFVHQSWWWRSRRSIHEKQKAFEPIPMGFRMSAHTPSSNSAPYQLLKALYKAPVTTVIDFVLPNMRFEQIRCGRAWFSSRATVTPIRRDLCRLDFCAAWHVPPCGALIGTALNFFGPRFIHQDTDTMSKQSIGLKHQPKLMLIDDADRPAKWYSALKATYLESRRTGAPMVHPMAGPVILKWRS